MANKDDDFLTGLLPEEGRIGREDGAFSFLFQNIRREQGGKVVFLNPQLLSAEEYIRREGLGEALEVGKVTLTLPYGQGPGDVGDKEEIIRNVTFRSPQGWSMGFDDDGVLICIAPGREYYMDSWEELCLGLDHLKVSGAKGTARIAVHMDYALDEGLSAARVSVTQEAAVELIKEEARPEILAFYADAESVPPGGKTQLTWNLGDVSRLASAILSNDQGMSPIDVKNRETHTYETEAIRAATDYKLEVTAADGAAFCERVTVRPAPPRLAEFRLVWPDAKKERRGDEDRLRAAPTQVAWHVNCPVGLCLKPVGNVKERGEKPIEEFAGSPFAVLSCAGSGRDFESLLYIPEPAGQAAGLSGAVRQFRRTITNFGAYRILDVTWETLPDSFTSLMLTFVDVVHGLFWDIEGRDEPARNSGTWQQLIGPDDKVEIQLTGTMRDGGKINLIL